MLITIIEVIGLLKVVVDGVVVEVVVVGVVVTTKCRYTQTHLYSPVVAAELE